MIRRLHRLRRFLCPVDRYQGVSGVCATGAALIGHWFDTSEERNLRNLRIINFLHQRLDQYSEVRP